MLAGYGAEPGRRTLDPSVAAGSHCAAAAPEPRAGWPPLPGDYHVLRYRAPVAVCTLNSDDLALRLAAARPSGLAIVSGLHTENLGIERLIRNLLPNPHVRFLVMCGADSRQSVGHLPGQSLVALAGNGLDERGRIIGARGKRPVLRNLISRLDHAAYLGRELARAEHALSSAQPYVQDAAPESASARQCGCAAPCSVNG